MELQKEKLLNGKLSLISYETTEEILNQMEKKFSK